MVSCEVSGWRGVRVTGNFRFPWHPDTQRPGHPSLDDESNDDRDNEGVDRDGLGQRRGQNHDRADLAGGFRVATDGLHRAAPDETDTDTRPDASEPNGEART